MPPKPRGKGAKKKPTVAEVLAQCQTKSQQWELDTVQLAASIKIANEAMRKTQAEKERWATKVEHLVKIRDRAEADGEAARRYLRRKSSAIAGSIVRATDNEQWERGVIDTLHREKTEVRRKSLDLRRRMSTASREGSMSQSHSRRGRVATFVGDDSDHSMSPVRTLSPHNKQTVEKDGELLSGESTARSHERSLPPKGRDTHSASGRPLARPTSGGRMRQSTVSLVEPLSGPTSACESTSSPPEAGAVRDVANPFTFVRGGDWMRKRTSELSDDSFMMGSSTRAEDNARAAVLKDIAVSNAQSALTAAADAASARRDVNTTVARAVLAPSGSVSVRTPYRIIAVGRSWLTEGGRSVIARHAPMCAVTSFRSVPRSCVPVTSTAAVVPGLGTYFSPDNGVDYDDGEIDDADDGSATPPSPCASAVPPEAQKAIVSSPVSSSASVTHMGEQMVSVGDTTEEVAAPHEANSSAGAHGAGTPDHGSKRPSLPPPSTAPVPALNRTARLSAADRRRVAAEAFIHRQIGTAVRSAVRRENGEAHVLVVIGGVRVSPLAVAAANVDLLSASDHSSGDKPESEKTVPEPTDAEKDEVYIAVDVAWIDDRCGADDDTAADDEKEGLESSFQSRITEAINHSRSMREGLPEGASPAQEKPRQNATMVPVVLRLSNVLSMVRSEAARVRRSASEVRAAAHARGEKSESNSVERSVADVALLVDAAPSRAAPQGFVLFTSIDTASTSTTASAVPFTPAHQLTETGGANAAATPNEVSTNGDVISGFGIPTHVSVDKPVVMKYGAVLSSTASLVQAPSIGLTAASLAIAIAAAERTDGGLIAAAPTAADALSHTTASSQWLGFTFTAAEFSRALATAAGSHVALSLVAADAIESSKVLPPSIARALNGSGAAGSGSSASERPTQGEPQGEVPSKAAHQKSMPSAWSTSVARRFEAEARRGVCCSALLFLPHSALSMAMSAGSSGPDSLATPARLRRPPLVAAVETALQGIVRRRVNGRQFRDLFAAIDDRLLADSLRVLKARVPAFVPTAPSSSSEVATDATAAPRVKQHGAQCALFFLMTPPMARKEVPLSAPISRAHPTASSDGGDDSQTADSTAAAPRRVGYLPSSVLDAAHAVRIALSHTAEDVVVDLPALPMSSVAEAFPSAPSSSNTGDGRWSLVPSCDGASSMLRVTWRGATAPPASARGQIEKALSVLGSRVLEVYAPVVVDIATTSAAAHVMANEAASFQDVVQPKDLRADEVDEQDKRNVSSLLIAGVHGTADDAAASITPPGASESVAAQHVDPSAALSSTQLMVQLANVAPAVMNDSASGTSDAENQLVTRWQIASARGLSSASVLPVASLWAPTLPGLDALRTAPVFNVVPLRVLLLLHDPDVSAIAANCATAVHFVQQLQRTLTDEFVKRTKEAGPAAAAQPTPASTHAHSLLSLSELAAENPRPELPSQTAPKFRHAAASNAATARPLPTPPPLFMTEAQLASLTFEFASLTLDTSAAAAVAAPALTDALDAKLPCVVCYSAAAAFNAQQGSRIPSRGEAKASPGADTAVHDAVSDVAEVQSTLSHDAPSAGQRLATKPVVVQRTAKNAAVSATTGTTAFTAAAIAAALLRGLERFGGHDMTAALSLLPPAASPPQASIDQAAERAVSFDGAMTMMNTTLSATSMLSKSEAPGVVTRARMDLTSPPQRALVDTTTDRAASPFVAKTRAAAAAASWTVSSDGQSEFRSFAAAVAAEL